MDIEDLKQRIVVLEALVAAMLAERSVDDGLDGEGRREAIIDLATEHAAQKLGGPGAPGVGRVAAIGEPWIRRLQPDD